MRARDIDMRRGRVHAAGRWPHLSSAPLLRCTTGDDVAEGEGILLSPGIAEGFLRVFLQVPAISDQPPDSVPVAG
jgi:hypothetical protein